MNTYNPLYALFIFIGLSLLIYLLFRPTKGWFWLIKNNYKINEKTVIEDVLKHLYHNENSNNNINSNDLVNALKYNDNVIIKSIEKMIENELIFFEKESLKLTGKGRDYALKIVRVHRLWEKYLAENTGFDKSEWHDIAEHKEHEINDEEANILAAKLGNPIFDPHGDPIPTHTGKMASINGSVLSSLTENTIGRIIHIEDKPDIIYKQILAENIHIGSQIRIVENNPTRIVFYSEGEEFKLAPILAGNITVSVLEKNEVLDDDVVRLSSLKNNETAVVIGISKESRGESRRRLLDLGFVKGSKVSIDLLNPLGEPTAYLIKGATIALRNNQALKILIKKD